MILSVVSANIFSIEIKVPVVEESPLTHQFYTDLLTQSFELIDEPLNITLVRAPQLRLMNYLNSGQIDLLWMVETETRNIKFDHVSIGLTNGLIGKRVFLIRADEQMLFDYVEDLESLRESGLVAAFGQGWYDSKVWQANDLKYKEQGGNWLSIYPKLVNYRDYDYFPRGINEIVKEAHRNPRLQIESNLVLEYQRDFIFYFSESGKNKKI